MYGLNMTLLTYVDRLLTRGLSLAENHKRVPMHGMRRAKGLDTQTGTGFALKPQDRIKVRATPWYQHEIVLDNNAE
jgi:hypothetical protein